jgi:transcriptional regulator
VRENPYYELTDEAEIRRLIRENPWATLVSNSSSGLVASHYPILLEEGREELSILTHVGRPDENVHELGEHELLVIVQGPHGYISSSWYGSHIEVPTWNFIVAHLSGLPEILDPAENFEVLTRLVDHFEQHVDDPRPLDATPEVAADARRDSRGTVGLRLGADADHRQAEDEPEQIAGDRPDGAARTRGQRSLREPVAGARDEARSRRQARPGVTRG